MNRENMLIEADELLTKLDDGNIRLGPVHRFGRSFNQAHLFKGYG